jgi:dihydrofolate reductase
MRKVKYHVASTADGFIAHEDHTVRGFLGEGEHVTDYVASLRSDYDVVVMGRRTYEFGFQYGVTSPYPWLKQYVLSRSMEASPDPAVEVVADDAVAFVRGLREGTGKDVYLCGGAELASTLLAAGLIDEVVLKLNPVIFGTGLPLFSGPVPQTALELVTSTTYPNGVLLLRYRVVREDSSEESPTGG